MGGPLDLYKLSQAGVEGRMLGWLQDYLSNRKFKVIFEGEYSSVKNITSGVPQGGILSPLLFNILLSDLPNTPNVSMSVYADDIAVYSSHGNYEIAFQNVQNHIDKLVYWATINGQEFNEEKAIKLMFFDKLKNITRDQINHLSRRQYEYITEMKLLGMTFDSPKLTWSHHINILRSSCNKRVNLLKSISHNHWGSSRDSLLILYKSLVRSKIDYGCHLYKLGTQQALNTLESIQNQCIRIATGTRATTPIVSLQVEGLIYPLKLRRIELSLKYISRIMEQHSSSPILKLYKAHVSKASNYNSFFKNILDTMQTWNIRRPSTNNQWSCNILPPWAYIEESIVGIFPVQVKSRNDYQILEIFKDMKENKYNSFVMYYTDGSKSESAAGAAFITDTEERSYNLPAESSVMTTELFAILKATEHASTQNPGQQCVIFSDSLSSMLLLQSTKPRSYRNLIHNIQYNLMKANNNITLQWIPGHRGIPGNDRADTLAKVANTKPRTVLMLPTEDYYKIINENVNKQWLQQWHNAVRSEAKGRHFFSIKDNLDFWPWCSHKSRVIETALARLRVGHAGTAQHLFRFGMSPSPLCDCGEIDTISHLLLECQRYHEERSHLIDSIKDEKINLPMSLKMLLGGENTLSNDQQFSVQNLYTYLRDINVLYVL